MELLIKFITHINFRPVQLRWTRTRTISSNGRCTHSHTEQAPRQLRVSSDFTKNGHCMWISHLYNTCVRDIQHSFPLVLLCHIDLGRQFKKLLQTKMESNTTDSKKLNWKIVSPTEMCTVEKKHTIKSHQLNRFRGFCVIHDTTHRHRFPVVTCNFLDFWSNKCLHLFKFDVKDNAMASMKKKSIFCFVGLEGMTMDLLSKYK